VPSEALFIPQLIEKQSTEKRGRIAEQGEV
jgi:hypothetical protein